MNIVYDKFLEGLIKGKIDILNDSFKIALVTDLYEPSASDDNFYKIQERGFEVNSKDTGYDRGGREFSFSEKDSNSLRIYFTSKSGNTIWKNVSLTARAAVIYRDDVSKTLVSYYDFGGNNTVRNGDFILSWTSTYVLSVAAGAVPPEPPTPPYTVDSNLSKESVNAAQNKILTNTLGRVGVRLGQYNPETGEYDIEGIPEGAGAITEDLDIITGIPDRKIDAIFEEDEK